MKAYLGIRDQPHYRYESFTAGLAAAGHTLMKGTPREPDADTLFISWNRYFSNHDDACRVEAAGGKVLIAENAYLNGRKDGGDYVALARSYHNDSQSIPEAGGERWKALGIDLKPWRVDGKHILVCPNRPFGTPGRIMPPFWANEVAEKLAGFTKREIRIRSHPGNSEPSKPLAEDFVDAWATVIWSSSVGVKSLIAGIPVVCDAPAWICKPGTVTVSDIGAAIDHPSCFASIGRDLARQLQMEKLAAAQFTFGEVASGFAFDYLLK